MAEGTVQEPTDTKGELSSSQIIFVHIEKTAGSSLLASLIEPNADDHERIGRVSSYWAHRNVSCVSGHIPYGLHWLAPRPVAYITMLRDPIDRAVSWYYFIKDLVRTDLWSPHPLREYADSVTLVEFYQNPQYSNMQTRFLAGWPYHKAYPLLHRSSAFRRSMVQAAQDHLNNCVAFGLQSRYDASVSLFQDVLGWTEYEPTPPQAKTKKRPSLEEIDDLNPTVLPQLRESHQLDTQLHQYAMDLFDAQF